MTAIEACIDTAQHICSVEGWGPPDDNGDAMRLLGRQGLFDADQADRMAQAVGFRNVLVHEYVRVDDAVVLRRLDDLSDLEDFIAAATAYVTR